ncbi:hypothetical protein [Mycolicibacterium vanbaalenii]|uniref:hypothetical protein n=1 Tax=Mycolicibacterium vanbaalenii TaxID=110539 RepID=UPI001301562A|nr:hypothetical protein [Mycolicibacterium vanbaalenii]
MTRVDIEPADPVIPCRDRRGGGSRRRCAGAGPHQPADPQRLLAAPATGLGTAREGRPLNAAKGQNGI